MNITKNLGIYQARLIMAYNEMETSLFRDIQNRGGRPDKEELENIRMPLPDNEEDHNATAKLLKEEGTLEELSKKSGWLSDLSNNFNNMIGRMAKKVFGLPKKQGALSKDEDGSGNTILRQEFYDPEDPSENYTVETVLDENEVDAKVSVYNTGSSNRADVFAEELSALALAKIYQVVRRYENNIPMPADELAFFLQKDASQPVAFEQAKLEALKDKISIFSSVGFERGVKVHGHSFYVSSGTNGKPAITIRDDNGIAILNGATAEEALEIVHTKTISGVPEHYILTGNIGHFGTPESYPQSLMLQQKATIATEQEEKVDEKPIEKKKLTDEEVYEIMVSLKGQERIIEQWNRDLSTNPPNADIIKDRIEASQSIYDGLLAQAGGLTKEEIYEIGERYEHKIVEDTKRDNERKREENKHKTAQSQKTQAPKQ